MEKELRAGKILKYITYKGDYLYFEYTKSEQFVVTFFEIDNNSKIYFFGDFDKMLDTANKLIFNYKLQICLEK